MNACLFYKSIRAYNGPLSGWKSCEEKEAQTRKHYPVGYKLCFSEVLLTRSSFLWHIPLFLQSPFLTSNSMWGWWGFFTSEDSAQHCCIQLPLLVQSLSQYALRLSRNIIWKLNCLETGYVWYEIRKYEFAFLFLDKCSSFSKSDSSTNFIMYLCPCFV